MPPSTTTRISHLCALFTGLSATLPVSSAAALLDTRAFHEHQDFRINRDFHWFEKTIPFFARDHLSDQARAAKKKPARGAVG